MYLPEVGAKIKQLRSQRNMSQITLAQQLGVSKSVIGLTDKTQELYQLIKENFDLSRPMSSGKGERTNGKGGKSFAMLEELSEEELLQQMSAEQREVFADLIKTKSPHWKKNRWQTILVHKLSFPFFSFAQPSKRMLGRCKSLVSALHL